MSKDLLSRAVTGMRSLDDLSRQSTPVHRLDPRVKLILVFVFVFLVMSFPPYSITALVSFFSFPLWLATAGQIPLRALFRKLLVIMPLALLIGIFNPFLDSAPVSIPFVGSVSRGWLSLGSIMLRFLLCAGAGLLLIGTTGPLFIARAMRQLKFPKLLGAFFLLIYRYLFVLIEEFFRLNQARICRSSSRKPVSISLAGSMMGSVLIRTWDRAERITSAMQLRGFRGSFPLPAAKQWNRRDTVTLFVWLLLLVLFRVINIPAYSGRIIMGWFS